MIKKIKNFRDLDIWKKGIEIVKDIYKTVRKFPKLELYSLTNQIQRASLSIPTNIAEGFNRFHNKEYKQFLYTALGFCAELETQIEISKELKYTNEENKKIILEKINHESCKITNLIKKLN